MLIQERKKQDGITMRKKRQPQPEPITRRRKKRFPEINIGKLISDYLIHSYLYYEKNVQVISDNQFDGIVEKLLENFDKVQKSDHIHKYLIDKTALEGFTGFHLMGKFPNSVKIPAMQISNKNKTIQEIITEI